MKKINYILTLISLFFISVLPVSAASLAQTSYAPITDIDKINHYHPPLTFGSICAIILFAILMIIYLVFILRNKKDKKLVIWSLGFPISLLFFLLVQVKVIPVGYIMFLLYALSFAAIFILEKLFNMIMKRLLKKYKLLHPILLCSYMLISNLFIIFILLFNSIGMIYKVLSIIELGIVIYLSFINYNKYHKAYTKKAGIE